MHVETAQRLITQVSYKPGWEFSLSRSYQVGNYAYLTIRFVGQDTDRQYAPDYERSILLSPQFRIDLNRIAGPEEFFAEVFARILWTETHEAREYFAVAGTSFIKMFHPHRVDFLPVWERHAPAISAAVASTFGRDE